jgi:Ni2+-binding GTPase involved in maturation of urease and hydrogenase
VSTELIVVGGFLGAGKTTSILSIAKYLLSSGKKVGIVTNDQGSDLVDTNFLKASGMSVLEVTGGCFCCNFEEFINKVQTLAENEMPDVIIAEPVGSCTDLIATIFKPIELKYMAKVLLRPLSVVVDPKRIKRLLIEESSGFHSEINYLFKKQLEEADIIVLNKIDCLVEEEIKKISQYQDGENRCFKFKSADIVCVSAKNDINIGGWIYTIYDVNSTKARPLDIDYTMYGDAEARLGWLNLTASLVADKNVDINQLIEKIMNELKEEFIKSGFEIAHLKIYGVSEEDWCKASITTIHEELDFSKKTEKTSSRWNVIINARIDAKPEALKSSLEKIFFRAVEAENMKIKDLNMECFKPGKPNPTYRMA